MTLLLAIAIFSKIKIVKGMALFYMFLNLYNILLIKDN